MTIHVTKSPYVEDRDLPWSYGEDAFLDWVDEVFRESYKRDVEPISIEEAIALLTTLGYTVEKEIIT